MLTWMVATFTREHCTTSDLDAVDLWLKHVEVARFVCFCPFACFCPTHGEHFATQMGCEQEHAHRAHEASMCLENWSDVKTPQVRVKELLDDLN